MKKILICVVLVRLIVPLTLEAQTTVYSDVGGFNTVIVAGSGNGESRLTFTATQFLRSTKHSGVATLTGSGQLHDVSAAWAEGAFNGINGSHYVEILKVNGQSSGFGVGLTRTISATSAAEKTLTLESPFPEGLAAPLEYRVISHWTLGSVFGLANSAGLQGGTAVTADLVQLWNSSGYDSYFFQTSGVGGVGWRRVGDQSTDASGTVIRQDQSILIKRSGVPALPLVLHGWVKTGQGAMEIANGYNFMPNPFAEALTLGSCGLFTGDPLTGIAPGNAAGADQVMLWNGASYDTYYFQTLGLGGTGWRKAGAQSVDAAQTKIEAGTSIIVWRKHPDGFTWNIPSP